jgi:hypothetical protein
VTAATRRGRRASLALRLIDEQLAWLDERRARLLATREKLAASR